MCAGWGRGPGLCVCLSSWLCSAQASLVHTTETIRIRYFMDLLMEKGWPVMLVGNAGTGKSVLMGDKLASLSSDEYLVQAVPFNFYTTSAMLQGEELGRAPVGLPSLSHAPHWFLQCCPLPPLSLCPFSASTLDPVMVTGACLCPEGQGPGKAGTKPHRVFLQSETSEFPQAEMLPASPGGGVHQAQGCHPQGTLPSSVAVLAAVGDSRGPGEAPGEEVRAELWAPGHQEAHLLHRRHEHARGGQIWHRGAPHTHPPAHGPRALVRGGDTCSPITQGPSRPETGTLRV